MKKFGLVALLLVFASCGKDLCVGPFGDCWKDLTPEQREAAPVNGSPRTGGVQILLPREYQNGTEVPPNTPIKLIGTGGTGNYLWDKLDGVGDFPMNGRRNNEATLTIPNSGARVKIRITDSAGTASRPIVITAE